MSALPPEPAAPPAAARRNAFRWAFAASLLLAVAAFYALGLQRYFSWDALRAHLTAWQDAVARNLLLALLLYFLTYVAVTALSLPVASSLTLVGGALFGRVLGTAVVSLAATAGATLAFLSSRYLFRDAVRRRLGRRLDALEQGIERDGAYYLFTLRLVPLFPFFLINLGMGLTPMRVSIYAPVSFVGMLPGTFLYVNAGTALATLESPAGLLSPGVLVSLALLGVAPLLVRKLIGTRPRDTRQPNQTPIDK
jgi:uncharacterized membrane protein YdjX (TVP38/TMEM64 family)